ncbi:BatA domain-containing protein [Mariniblastus sp.]|nr:BatA domain-containing protein [Mariniblastus sp.]
MLSWFLNPWMLLGAAAIASPILIHLLNKRRFKIVEWAAMDFLFQADKKNRRRVQLENFILLALRCLAMLLVALMLARPFLPSSLTNVIQQSQKIERVLLVDDSLSQTVPRGNSTAFDETKIAVKEMIARYAESNKTEDWLTLMIASDPENPIFANEPLTMATLATLGESIDQLDCVDRGVDYSAALDRVSRYLTGQREAGGRALYVFSDLRQLDWNVESDSETAPNKMLASIGDAVEGCFVVDTGDDNDQNLSVTSVRPLEFPIAGKVIPFEVMVKNNGAQDVQQVRVMFQVDEGQPEYETIANLAPGRAVPLEFRYVFPASATSQLQNALSEIGQDTRSPLTNYRVLAQIDRVSLGQEGLEADQLVQDSESLYAARVTDGIPVLLVDGAPSPVSERSDTHYLRSLEVPGAGLKMTTISPADLETVSLSDYRVIFLCNMDEASAPRVRSLERWVANGGAVVFMPGDRVRAQTFNDAFYREGAGLSPVKLETIQGDPSMAQWANFEVDPQMHPSLEVVLESEATSVSKIDVFLWWKSIVNPALLGKTTSVPLRLNDGSKSPAMVDRNFGKGRVVFFAFPADADWSMWPTGATFVPINLGLIDDFVGNSSESTVIQAGGVIRYPVDLSAYQNRVSLTNPNGDTVETVAAPIKDKSSDESKKDEAAAKDADGNLASSTPEDLTADPATEPEDENESTVLYEAEFPPIDGQGFYEMKLQRNDGGEESILFAANVDASEGDLKRMSKNELGGDFFGGNVKLVTSTQLADQTVKGGSSELWMFALIILFCALTLEQFLGWFWGRNR